MTNTIELEAQTLPALGRPERKIPLDYPKEVLRGKRILVTGAAGSLGQVLVPELWKLGAIVISTDIEPTGAMERMDVRNFEDVMYTVRFHEPDLIYHLAAEKLAPKGEQWPYQTAMTNIQGTQNVLNMGVKTVLAGTCKAGTKYCTYGLSKMIAERLVLNVGGTVVRYFNVPSAGPSMVSIWNELDEDDALPVTPCWRYLITWKEAIALSLWGGVLPAGRYIVDPGDPVLMGDYAERLFPGRTQVEIPPRRGDSVRELLHAPEESLFETNVPFIYRVSNPND